MNNKIPDTETRGTGELHADATHSVADIAREVIGIVNKAQNHIAPNGMPGVVEPHQYDFLRAVGASGRKHLQDPEPTIEQVAD